MGVEDPEARILLGQARQECADFAGRGSNDADAGKHVHGNKNGATALEG